MLEHVPILVLLTSVGVSIKTCHLREGTELAKDSKFQELQFASRTNIAGFAT